jgi:hypothetical protein
MEDEIIRGGAKTESFLGYMTTVTILEKNELLNVFQYILLVIIPLVLFLKFMKDYIPPESASKSSIEITTEVVIQLFLIFVVFWLIHKVVMYIPTYSTVPYEKLNLIQIAMPVLFLLFCMKSSISEKLSILLDRTLIGVGLKQEAMTEDPKKKNPQGNMGPQLQRPMNTMPESRQMPEGQHPDRQMSEMNMNYGISEPLAANEMGSPFVNY